MYLRQTKRTNRDGSVVSYLQLAHSERNPRTGNSVAKVIHNFGRAEKVDRDGLARLVKSISRFLTPEQAAVLTTGPQAGAGEVEVLGSRRLGGTWTLGQVWDRLGIGATVRQVAIWSAPGCWPGGAGLVRSGRPACPGAGQQAGSDRLGRAADGDRGPTGVE